MADPSRGGSPLDAGGDAGAPTQDQPRSVPARICTCGAPQLNFLFHAKDCPIIRIPAAAALVTPRPIEGRQSAGSHDPES